MKVSFEIDFKDRDTLIDIAHWCVVVAVVVAVAWLLFENFIHIHATEPIPETVPQSADSLAAEPTGPNTEDVRTWYKLFLDTAKTFVPLIIPFASQWARNKFKTGNNE